MSFVKYQHLERFGADEVKGIEKGIVYVFPKLDGTNGSIWLGEDGVVKAGSRNRELTLDNDNAGFYKWVLQQDNIKRYLEQYPDHILYGEWLVPHSLKTYRENAWRKFYVYDVAVRKTEDEMLHEFDSFVKYLYFSTYSHLLCDFNIDYVPVVSILKSPDYDKLLSQLEQNTYLIKDGEGVGEGIVLKNYDFYNKYNRQTWAKIVTNEFKEKHKKEFGLVHSENKKLLEEEIASKYVTKSLVEKVYAKISLEQNGFTSKNIAQLLNTVFYDVVKEDCWDFVKENKFPTIDFKLLKQIVFRFVKTLKPQLF